MVYKLSTNEALSRQNGYYNFLSFHEIDGKEQTSNPESSFPLNSGQEARDSGSFWFPLFL